MGSGQLREGLLASWRAAERQSTLTGELCLNYASAAGWLLAEFGSVAEALAHLPSSSSWWSTVAHYLRMVAIDEVPLAQVRAEGRTLHAIRR